MRGFYQGKWYAEVSESTRHVGIETISVHEFDTEQERDKFVDDYNQILLSTHGGPTPDVYRIASSTPFSFVVSEFLRGKYQNG